MIDDNAALIVSGDYEGDIHATADTIQESL
jgi:hypothetical protein